LKAAKSYGAQGREAGAWQGVGERGTARDPVARPSDRGRLFAGPHE